MTDAADLSPRANPLLIGHSAAERTLLQAARSGRLPHAWLLGGPQGVGKATLAFRFARWLLATPDPTEPEGPSLFGEAAAPDTDTLHVDPAAPVFRRVAAAGHADLLTIGRAVAKADVGKDPEDQRLAREISVDEARRIQPFLRLTPAEGGWRVVVVDEAETLNRNAANAILKVLEEPPPRAVLLLVSNNPGAMLPTIRSRCRRLRLGPLTPAELDHWMTTRVPELSEQDRAVLTVLADGSPGRALRLWHAGASALYGRFLQVLAPLPHLDLPAVRSLCEEVAAPSAETSYRVLSELMLWWLERVARAPALGPPMFEAVPGERDMIARLASTAPAGGRLDRWLQVWEKVRQSLAQSDGANLDRKQTLLQAFLSIQSAARA